MANVISETSHERYILKGRLGKYLDDADQSHVVTIDGDSFQCQLAKLGEVVLDANIMNLYCGGEVHMIPGFRG